MLRKFSVYPRYRQPRIPSILRYPTYKLLKVLSAVDLPSGISSMVSGVLVTRRTDYSRHPEYQFSKYSVFRVTSGGSFNDGVEWGMLQHRTRRTLVSYRMVRVRSYFSHGTSWHKVIEVRSLWRKDDEVLSRPTRPFILFFHNGLWGNNILPRFVRK